MIAGIVIVLFTGIVFFDYIPRRKNRKKKENIFYAAVLAVSFFILMLYSLGFDLPSPTKAIESIVKAVVPIK